jgi:hypothetical protein
VKTPVVVLLLAALAPSQQAPPSSEAIAEARAREVVSFLASDELRGRDTPSPGLERAADWLAEQFAAAGLQPVLAGSWFHRYQLAGVRLDPAGVVLRVQRQEGDSVVERDLAAGEDVRVLRGGVTGGAEWLQATVALHGDPRVGRLLLAPGGRRPILLEVDAEDPAWAAAAEPREMLGGPRQGARPVFLIRRGALPSGDADKGRYSVRYQVPEPAAVQVALRNVVGVLPGREQPDEYVLVSAHYDHIGVGPAEGGDAIYNGADDDATGTTAVVLLAEALAKGPRPRRSVAFVCFSAEEKGLRGSRAFAADPPFPLTAVAANVNVEMIGRPLPGRERTAWITGADLSDFAAIAAPALARAGIELVEFDLARQLFAASDNYSLAVRGVVAHSLSAGSLHRDYHRPSDEVDKLDLPHMTAVIRGLREVVLELANRPATPAWNEAGRRALERGRRG